MVDCDDDESAVYGLTATPVVVLFQLGAGLYTHFSPFPKQGKSHTSLIKHFSWFPKW
jgi:hypothetical protein